jgi:hypothetical protein
MSYVRRGSHRRAESFGRILARHVLPAFVDDQIQKRLEVA